MRVKSKSKGGVDHTKPIRNEPAPNRGDYLDDKGNIVESFVLLRDEIIPACEVAKLGSAALAVYSLMFQSASFDKEYDDKKHLPWKYRRCRGGCTEWTTKGLANELGMCKKTVLKAIDALQDNGFISLAGWKKNIGKGSPSRIFRVIPYNRLESMRKAIDLVGRPSERVYSQKKNLSNENWDPESFSDLFYQEEDVYPSDSEPWILTDSHPLNEIQSDLWSNLKDKLTEFKKTETYTDWCEKKEWASTVFRTEHVREPLNPRHKKYKRPFKSGFHSFVVVS